MFKALREISALDAFRRFISDFVGENEFVEQQTHGVRLAVDEYWLDHWFLQQALLPPYVAAFPFQSARRMAWMRRRLLRLGLRIPTLADLLRWGPPLWWPRYCAARGWPPNSGPIRILVSLRPGTALGELEGYRRVWDHDGAFYPIDLEIQPLVRAHSHRRPVKPLLGGTSVGPAGGIAAESGTLGGIARYGSESLAFTCAHVFPGAVAGDEVWHPAASDDGAAARVGALRQVVQPQPRQGALCNRTATYATTSDVAVITIDPIVDADLLVRRVGAVDALRGIDQIGCYDDVVFVGKESDEREARTEQLSHWQEITLDGTPYCYRDMFTIGFRTATYIARSLSTFGDSGAWILSDGVGYPRELLGMLVGGDGAKAFCAFAENVINDAGLVSSNLRLR